MKIHKIDSEYADIIEEIISSEYFPWYFNDETSESEYSKKINPPSTIHTDRLKEVPQFIHNLYESPNYRTSFLELIETIADTIDSKLELVRLKVNLLQVIPNYDNNDYHMPHVDFTYDDTEKYISAIYYVNDSDGDTFFFDKKYGYNGNDLEVIERITPKKGTFIVFDSNKFHSSSSPTKNIRRMVINIVFKIIG